MNKKAIVLFFLAALLVACTSIQPTISPTANTSFISTSLPTLPIAHLITPSPRITHTQTSEPAPAATPTPSSEKEIVLERVAQTGGGINGITIVGDVAYVGMGSRLAAIDISQHEQTQLIGKSAPLPGLVTQLLQVSRGATPLLLIGAGKYLVLVDPSAPGELKPIFQLELDGAITALVWEARSSRAYAGVALYQRPTAFTGMISSIKITPENQFKLINSIFMPEFPLSLALSEGGLFAGAQGYAGGLYHIHMDSTGALFKPHQVIASGAGEPLQPLYLQVVGTRLYLSYRNIEAYDISDPDHPLKIWSAHVSGCDIVKGFSVVRDQAFAFGWTILSEFVRGAVTLPEPMPGPPVGENASVTAVHNGDFLVANNTLEIYAIDNPQALKLIGSYQEPLVNVLDAAANDRAIYAVDIGDGGSTTRPILRVLSLPDLTPLAQVTTELSTWYNFCGISLAGDRLYLANEHGLWAYGVANIEPVLLGKVDLLDGQLEAIATLEVDGKRLLFAIHSTEGNNNIMRVFDLTDLQNPILLSSPLTLTQGFSLEMTRNGFTLYSLMEYVRYSSPNRSLLSAIRYENDALELKGILELPGYLEHLAVADNLIMLAGTDSSLNSSSVSLVDSESLNLLSQAILPGPAAGLAILKDMSLAVDGYHLDGGQNGAAEMLIYDIRDPLHPRQMGVMDLAVSTNYKVPILKVNSYLVLVNGSGGLEVLEYTR